MEKFLSSVFTREEMVLHKAEFETAFKDSEDGEKLSYFYWKNWVLDHKDTGNNYDTAIISLSPILGDLTRILLFKNSESPYFF
jgi:hypothetical protein